MPRVHIIMGVSGCGKTTIGKQLAAKLKLPFYDADDFHPKANVAKMKNNISLNDDDRKPWLETLAIEIEKWSKNSGAVLACSALKEMYRNILSSHSKNVDWIFLSGSFETILERIQQRKGHYMKSDLLQSQFDTLEIPSYGLHIDIENDVESLINELILKFKQDV
jgi:carbohydrate kinase (thermoresistant glucokinase family)